jgi:hypothetical protein
LLFTLYINDVTHTVSTAKIILYADDTAIYIRHADSDFIQTGLTREFARVADWLEMNKLTLNVKKTKCMFFGTPSMLANAGSLSLSHDNIEIEQVPNFKYLGLILDNKLSFKEHLCDVSKKIASKISILGRVRKYLPIKHRLMLFNSLILPHFDYASIVWSNTNSKYTDPLVSLSKRAARVIWGAKNSEEAFRELRWEGMTVRWTCQRAVMMYRVSRGLVPPYFANRFTSLIERNPARPVTRGQTQGNFSPCLSGNEWGRRRMASHGVFIWNDLPAATKGCDTLLSFKCNLKKLSREKHKFYTLKS